MKFKPRKIGTLLFVLIMVLIYLSTKSFDELIGMNEIIFTSVHFFLIIYFIMTAFKGTYIEILDDVVIKKDGYFTKKISIKEIKKVSLQSHSYFGPSLWVEYINGTHKVLLTLDTKIYGYRLNDVKEILKELKDKNVLLGENAQKILSEN